MLFWLWKQWLSCFQNYVGTWATQYSIQHKICIAEPLHLLDTMCKKWLLCLAAQKKVRLLCVSWLRQTENRQLFSHHRQAGQEKSVTYSSTVNSIKVTTRAHRDAPQPMNVSLVKISSSSGLHWDRKERQVVGERQKRGECCQRVLEVDEQPSHIWKIPHLIWKKVLSYVIAIHKWLHFYKLKILLMVLFFDELTNFYVL